MLIFRKMMLEDLSQIYNDMDLRPLITVSPNDKKFGIVIDSDGHIIGGVTGYIDGKNAMIQEIIVKSQDNYAMYKDGLIRALIHMLDLDGIKLLFASPIEDREIYTDIGFKKNNYCLSKTEQNTLCIDLEAFFCGQTC